MRMQASIQKSLVFIFTIALLLALGVQGNLSYGDDAPAIYWTDVGMQKIRRANLDGSNVQDIHTTDLLSIPRSITLDVDAGKMYWTQIGFSAGIQRANLDGSNIENLVEMGLFDPAVSIALDVDAGKMYWTQVGFSMGIQRANLDGSNIEDLVEMDLFSGSIPDGIALDVAAGKMYWTDTGLGKIQRANLDGSNVEDLVTGLDGTRGIALDVSGGKMYWTDWITHKIQRANLNGSNVQDLVTTGLDSPWGIALDVAGDKMYWVHGEWNADTETYINGKIQRANLDGSNVEDLIATGVDNPISIALSIPSQRTPVVAQGDVQTTPDTGSPTVGGTGPYRSIYWTDETTNKIQWANLDGTNIQDITENLYPGGITVDVAGGKMYWTDNIRDEIRRANLDGSNVQNIVTAGLAGPESIALDVAGGKMYWTSWLPEDKIQRANLNGSNVQALVTTGLDGPWNIALDVEGGKMYWTNRWAGKIQRANLNGTNVQDIVTDVYPDGIALDVTGGKMYWTDWLRGKIQRANLDGSNIQDLITTGLDEPSGIALDVAGGKMYWADTSRGKIQRANLNGTNVQDIVTGLGEPTRIALGPSSPGVWNLDVTGNGIVDNLDIIEVGKNYGKTVAKGANPRADVNEDGKVDINDLVAVAKAVDAAAAAPTVAQQLPTLPFTAQELAQWIQEAKRQNLSPRGIAVLEHLLEALTRSEMPLKETLLLPNYPNPFNPETWIPYYLAHAADVTVTIYDINGALVRKLDLGHQSAGYYTARTKAAYWDGCNETGESVASGVYFYHLSVGDFSATRRMLILK